MNQEQIANRIMAVMASFSMIYIGYDLIKNPPPPSPLPPVQTIADWEQLGIRQRLRVAGLIVAETQPQSRGLSRNIKTVRLWRCLNQAVKSGGASPKIDDATLLCSDNMGWD